MANDTLKQKKKKSPWLLFVILAALLSLACLVFYLSSPTISSSFKDPAFLWKRLFKPLLRMSLFISLGLFAGQIIEASGWTGRLSAMVRPLMRWGHLSDSSGASFTTAFVSGTAAQAMLVTFHEEGRLTRKEVILTSLLNGLPAFFLHLPTTFFIILPLAGMAGFLYLVLTFLAAVVRTVGLIGYARVSLPQRPLAIEKKEREPTNWRSVFQDTWKKFFKRLKRIMLVVVPVYVVVMLISQLGFFTWLRLKLAAGITTTLVPVESMSVVIFSLVAEFTSGFAAAGALLDTGALTIRETVIALLLGNVVATPVRALRHQLPYYMGIFRPKLGVLLITLGQTLRVITVILVGTVFVLLTAF
ncbi:MAG: nucleoside recognition protein [Deltaproteobacteria bacterium]|nr:MAG: nucleoside recognition protein [Deltaproteobacteria bacterium]